MSNSKIRIAVSGAGGGVGQSIIKALYDTGYEIVAFDGESLGTGLYAAPKSFVIPYAKEPSFIDRTVELCQKESCKLFFPGLDAELPYLSQAVDRFAEVGTQVIVSSPEVIELSDNKLLTYSTLTPHDISVPKTIDMASYTDQHPPLPYPFILKRKVGGHRSHDVHLIKNERTLTALFASGLDLSLFIAQEYIEGDEYTCGSVNLNGQCKGVIVMRRTLRDGDTYQSFTVKNDVIENEVRKIMALIKPFGACNVQLRLKDNKPYVLEINARCSGTTAARALCGFNEPKMIADYLCSNKQPSYTIKEQTILRYWKELVVDNAIIAEVERNGRLTNNSHPKL
ncbi:MAG TPA: ATP-grasp domain-containing protein [Candidatus Saccharimonadales bacterium]|nr:ATP-grasp domain-containing protein [Candidatus Saccharimonadales bacterium]